MRKLVEVAKTGLVSARIVDVDTFTSKEGLKCNKCYFTKHGESGLFEGMIYGKDIQPGVDCIIKPGNKKGKVQFFDVIRMQ